KILDHQYDGHWYFHGTNQEKLLKNEKRAISHGCHRNMNDNIAYLAGFLLSRFSDKLDVFDMPVSNGTRKVRLNAQIPTIKKYDTIEVFVSANPDESQIIFYPNVYGFSNESEFIQLTNIVHLKKDLVSAGFSEERLDMQKLCDLAEKAKKAKNSFTANVKDYLLF
ncbi:MAG: hypothetical protein PHD31_02545, partial [Candidatus Pacebacteria bacterium]|nr:hypothetical protein [Candidatus Paceibacterota bacterium]